MFLYRSLRAFSFVNGPYRGPRTRDFSQHHVSVVCVTSCSHAAMTRIAWSTMHCFHGILAVVVTSTHVIQPAALVPSFRCQERASCAPVNYATIMFPLGITRTQRDGRDRYCRLPKEIETSICRATLVSASTRFASAAFVEPARFRGHKKSAGANECSTSGVSKTSNSHTEGLH